MSFLEPVLSFVYNFVFYAAMTMAILLVAGVVLFPSIYKRVFPIPFILFKNAGGARDNNSIVLYKKIIRRGRIINTKWGKRVKLFMQRETLPMSALSRENAMPWEAGGVAFMLYEKEVGQFFPVSPHLQLMEFSVEKEKEANNLLKKVYQEIITKFPELESRVRLTQPRNKTLVSPVIFANHSVKLQPVPVNMINQFVHDMLIRAETYHKKGFMEKYGFYMVALFALVLIITVAVLSYEQVNQTISDRMQELNNGVGQQIANYFANQQPPPEGAVNGLMLPLWLATRRKTRKWVF